MRKQFFTNFKKAFSTAALCLCSAGVLLTGSLSSTIGDSISTESNLQTDSSEDDYVRPSVPLAPLNDDKDDRKDID